MRNIKNHYAAKRERMQGIGKRTQKRVYYLTSVVAERQLSRQEKRTVTGTLQEEVHRLEKMPQQDQQTEGFLYHKELPAWCDLKAVNEIYQELSTRPRW